MPKYWSVYPAGAPRAKGRSGLYWFLLSLLGGPVAAFARVARFDRESTDPWAP